MDVKRSRRDYMREYRKRKKAEEIKNGLHPKKVPKTRKERNQLYRQRRRERTLLAALQANLHSTSPMAVGSTLINQVTANVISIKSTPCYTKHNLDVIRREHESVEEAASSCTGSEYQQIDTKQEDHSELFTICVVKSEPQSSADENELETALPSLSLTCVPEVKLEEDPLELKIETKHNLDAIRREHESVDAAASSCTGSEYQQIDTKQEDQPIPFTFCVVKSEPQSDVVENELETALPSLSLTCVPGVKLEEDPLEPKIETRVIRLDNKPTYLCDICNKLFVDLPKFKKHYHMHSNDTLHPCDVCKKSFTKPQILKQHMRIHTGERPYSCDVCKKSFTQLGHLTQHQSVHTGERPYICDVCNRSFSQLHKMKLHQRIHTGERPYLCDVCSKSFSRPFCLRKHQSTHTGECRYSCDLCNKPFFCLSTLKQHQRVHAGERPYSCDLCEKSFTRLQKLKMHRRVHTGERPYLCVICMKSFSQPTHLKIHQRTHTGERPYLCDVCKKSYTSLFNLRTHILKHMSEQK